MKSESVIFFGFYLTKKGIEEHLDKSEAIIWMTTSTTTKEVMKFNEMLIALNRFITKLVQLAMQFYK